MTYLESLDYLYRLGHETLAMKFGLRNTEVLLADCDNPQKSFLKIQIAGTNGKGSTAAFLAAICRAANLTTGLYTSPHLIAITERIRINDREISAADFARLTTQVRTSAEGLVAAKQLAALPTFFEHLTAIALLAFREAQVDVAVLETGLGGRLDATTAAAAEIAGITSISFDHQEYLGNTLSLIAAEKAAIIRSGMPVVVAPQRPDAMQAILQRCEKVSVQPEIVDAECQIQETTKDNRYIVNLKTRRSVLPNVCLSLRGVHQFENAALAVVLAENLSFFNFEIAPAAIVQGLETAQHAGRLEFWTQTRPGILFDGAHNAAGAQTLRNFLKEFVAQPLTIIFGVMRDKDLSEIAQILFPLAQNLILTKVNNERSASLEQMRKLVSLNLPATIFEAATVAEALQIARAITPPESVICVTGSLYLIGEAQILLRAS